MSEKLDVNVCDVCLILDGDQRLKPGMYCSKCDAFICEQCQPKTMRRFWAMWKRRIFVKNIVPLLLISIAVLAPHAHAQVYDLPCPPGTNPPTSIFTTVVPQTGHLRAWGCVDSNGVFSSPVFTTTPAITGPTFTPEAAGSIQAAVNLATAASGGTVALCSGGLTTYPITSPITITLSGINIIGPTQRGCYIEIMNSTSNGIMVNCTSGAGQCNFNKFYGFTIYRSVNPTIQNASFYLNNTQWATIQQIEMYDSYYGFEQVTGDNTIIVNSQAGTLNATAGVQTSFAFQGSPNSSVFFHTNSVTATALAVPAGYSFTGGADFWCYFCASNGNGVGFLDSSGSMSDFHFINPVCESGLYCFQLDMNLASDCPNCYVQIIDPYMNANIPGGVGINNGQGVQVSGGTCNSQDANLNAGFCFACNGALCQRNSIHGVHVFTSAAAGGPLFWFFNSLGGSGTPGQNVIADNIIEGSSGAPFGTAISFQNGTSFNTVTGNQIDGFGTTGISFDSTSGNNQVCNNTLGGYGTITTNYSDAAGTNNYCTTSNTHP
jgi:hypothetical protein